MNTNKETNNIHKIDNMNGLSELIENIPDKPKMLFFEGNIDLLKDNHICVCIVGPRKASPYGFQVTEYIIDFLKDYNVVTISGAAYGIDGLVNTLSIKKNIKTVEKIDDDFFYPRAHLDLKHEILDNKGLIINEFEPQTRSSLWTFPVRNRLMAGMAHMTIVVEAEEKSGTLITANLAIDYNREVLAVPGNIFSRNSFGTNDLIDKGAKILKDANSLKEMLENIADRYDLELLKMS
jgi:DNA processing protein